MNIKIAYIGGGSKQWARVFMNDLALTPDLSGEIALYDIDKEAAIRNQQIGKKINESKDCISKWDYKVYDTIDEALKNATFVVISILPATFKEMYSDVHAPEKYGIYQAVGDTVGPGGILRAMRTVPIYEEFALKIKQICPNAWVINFTNPMSICTKTLYDVFPEIKAFGCCHEVFHAQEFLCLVLSDILNIKRPDRHEIYTDASGVNHFTWITEAKYKDIDILQLIDKFAEKYFDEGYYEQIGASRFAFKEDCFAYGNKVKMDTYRRFGALAAAGDRHLVEFMNNSWYLKNPEDAEKWAYKLTTVDFRIKQQEERILESIDLASGKKEVELVKSSEEAVELMKAILGYKTIVSNVNMPNLGQMPDMPLGSIVETNCVFSNDLVKPVTAKPLPLAVKNMVYRNLVNIDLTYEGIKKRDLKMILEAFLNQPLCEGLSYDNGYNLFKEMCYNTYEYLKDFFDLDHFFKK